MSFLDTFVNWVSLDSYDEEEDEQYEETEASDFEEEVAAKPRRKILSGFTKKNKKTASDRVSRFSEEEEQESVQEKAPDISKYSSYRAEAEDDSQDVVMSAVSGEKSSSFAKPKESFTQRSSRSQERTSQEKPPRNREKRSSSSGKITSFSSAARRSSSSVSPQEVHIVYPVSMESAREIAEWFCDNSVVILNLEGVDVDLAQRVIDFVSGCCFSLGGGVYKAAGYVYVIGPREINVSGDIQSIVKKELPPVQSVY